MADGRVTIDIEIDGKKIDEVNLKLDEFEKLLDDLEGKSSSIDRITDSFDEITKTVEKTKTSTEELGNSIDDVGNSSDSIDKVSDSMDNVGESSEKASDSVSNVSDSVDGIHNENIEQLDDSLSNVDETSTHTSDSLGDVSDSAKNIEHDNVDNLSDSLDQASDSSSHTSDNLGELNDSVKSIDDSNVKELSEDLSEASDKGKQTSDSLNDVKDSSSSIDNTQVEELADSIESVDEHSKKASDSIQDVKEATDCVDDGNIGELGEELDNVSGKAQDTSESLGDVDESLKGIDPKPLHDVGDEAEGARPKTDSLGDSILEITLALGAMKVATMAFDAMTQSMDAAIARFDTFSQFPRLLGLMGVEADEAAAAVDRLAKGVEGLPTRLDEVTNTAQRMFIALQDIDKATDSTIALNNALLASGSTGGEASRGVEAYIKMLQTGEPDLVSWKALNQVMSVGLKEVAGEFGYAGDQINSEFRPALRDGIISMDEFNDAMIRVGTGGGILVDMAMETSAGIATSAKNLSNAMVVGTTKVITAFDEMSQTITGNTIAENMDNMKGSVGAAFDTMAKAIEMTTPLMWLFIKAAEVTITVMKILSPLLIGVAANYLALKVVATITKLFTDENSVVKKNIDIMGKKIDKMKKVTKETYVSIGATMESIATKKAEKVADEANISMAGKIGKALAENITAIKNVVKSLVLKIQTTYLNIAAENTGRATTMAYAVANTVLVTAVDGVIAATKGLIAATWGLMAALGPVVIAVGLLVGAYKTWHWWSNRTTEAGRELASQQEDLVSAIEDSTSAVQSNIKTREQEKTSLQSTLEAHNDLIDSIEELSNKENKTAAEKQILEDKVNQLNEAYEDLNVVIDEETGYLSTSTEAMREHVKVYTTQERATQATKDLNNILKEQHDIESGLKDIEAQRQAWNKALKDGTVNSREHKKAIEELDDKEKELKVTMNKLRTQASSTSKEINSLNEEIVRNTKNTKENSKAMMNELEALSKKEKLSNAEKQRMVELSFQLNSAFSDLKISIDEETGALENSTEEYQKRLAVLLKHEEALGTQAELGELIQKQAENELKLAEAGKQREFWNVQLEEGGNKAVIASQNLGVLNEEEKKLKEEQQVIANEYKAKSDTIVQANEEMAQAVKDGTFVQTISWNDLSEKQQKVVNDMNATYKKYVDDIIAGNKLIEQDNEMSAALWADIMAQNTNTMKEFADGINKLQGRVSDEYLQYLKDLGVEQTPLIQELSAKTDEELKGFEAAWQGGMDAVGEITTAGLNLDHIPESAREMITKTDEAMQQQINEAGFDKIGEQMLEKIQVGFESQEEVSQKIAEDIAKNLSDGTTEAIEKEDFSQISLGMIEKLSEGVDENEEQLTETGKKMIGRTVEGMAESIEDANMQELGGFIPEGLAQGVEENSEQVTTATQNMGEKSKEGLTSTLGIQSPSTVFAEYGLNVVQGFVQGIEDATGLLTGAITKMYNIMNTEATNSTNDFVRINQKMITDTDSEFNKLEGIVRKAMNLYNKEIENGYRKMQASNQKMIADTEKEYNKLPEIVRKATDSMKREMDSGMAKIANASRGYSRDIVNGFSSLSSDMQSVGYNAMAGLNAGLNSGRSMVMATANSIASEVSATMRRALDVRSPSRVTKEIGFFTGQGFAIGLEQARSLVSRASKVLTDVVSFDMNQQVELGLAGQPMVRALNLSDYGAQNKTSATIRHTRNDGAKSENNGQREKNYIVLNNTIEMDAQEVGKQTAVFVQEENNKRSFILDKIRGA